MWHDLAAGAGLLAAFVALVAAILNLITAIVNRRKKDPTQLPKEKKEKYPILGGAKLFPLQSFLSQ